MSKAQRSKAQSIVFKYVNDRLEGKTIARPRVEVRVSNGKFNIRLVMLVDSGADTSFIPLEVAEVLQLKLGPSKISRSAAGPFTTKLGNVTAELIKGRKRIAIGKIPVNVPVKKVEKGNFLSYSLLGRIGIFNRFDITFRENTKKLILRTPKTYRNS